MFDRSLLGPGGGYAAHAVAVLLAALAVGGCAMSPRMEQAVPGPVCPGVRAARTATIDTASIRWYRAAEGRDVELARRWCSTVGAPVIRLRPQGDFPSWSSAETVDVASWNAQVNGGDLYGFLAGELGLDCSGVRPVLERGRPPFVLLLQEAWRYSESLPFAGRSRDVPWTIDEDKEGLRDPATPRPILEGEHDIVETAEACGLSLVYVPSARNGPDTDRRPKEDKGNAILSTLPLSTPIAFDLPHEGGRKVAVAATVRAPGGERVRVVTVHLDVASTLIRTLVSGNQTRARQVRGLLDGLSLAERDGPLTRITVVGGDFNTWVSNETALELMREAFPESPEWDGLPTRDGFPPDHIFFRGRGSSAVEIESYRRVGEPYGSDHHGRRATLRHMGPEGMER